MKRKKSQADDSPPFPPLVWIQFPFARHPISLSLFQSVRLRLRPSAHCRLRLFHCFYAESISCAYVRFILSAKSSLAASFPSHCMSWIHFQFALRSRCLERAVPSHPRAPLRHWSHRVCTPLWQNISIPGGWNVPMCIVSLNVYRPHISHLNNCGY